MMIKPIMPMSLLHNPHLSVLNGPKTPSPLPKSKILDEADELLCLAEREFTLAEAKLYDHLSSNKSSARCASSQPPSARKTMTDFQQSDIKDLSLQDRFKEVDAPPNSPASFAILKDKEKYQIKNGEKKNLKSKSLCTYHSGVTNTFQLDQQSKANVYHQQDNLDISSDFTNCRMIHNDGRLINKKLQNERENNIPDTPVISMKNLSLKKDVETNTDPEYVFPSMMAVKNASNSSIINIKSSKPEREDQCCGTASNRRLNINKMPSVNIRPEFTIHPGPKINIASSSKSLFEIKRKNAELFDLVYPTNSPLLSGHSEVRREKQTAPSGSHVEYVCERHVFPGGKLISGAEDDTFRTSFKVDGLTLEEKKEMLMDLIKLVIEKIDKQLTKGNNCCRLKCSLPLLGSVVNKIQVDCAKCLDGLSGQLGMLIQLMKEELRSHREFSEEHCGQLNDTVQYQIVELELMQDDSSQEQSKSGRVFKHQENNDDPKVLKKTVSFENIKSELARTTNLENNKATEKKDVIKMASNKNMSSKRKVESKTKPLLNSYHSQISGKSQNTSGSRHVLNNNKANKPQILGKKVIGPSNYSNTKPRETNFTTEGYRTKTIVGQVVKNISSRKSILKKDFSPINLAPKESISNTNVLYQVVDNKETSNEFDQWIEERSLKIRKIHEELNNILSRSTERYIETKPGGKQKIKEQNRKHSEEDSNKEGNEKEVISNPNNEDQFACDNGEEGEKRELEEQCTNSSAQESNQDYMEDFEEDDEEEEKINKNNKDSVNNSFDSPLEGQSSENTNEVAEAENGSSSSSKMSEVFKNGDIEPLEILQEKASEKQGTDITLDKTVNDSPNDPVGTFNVQDVGDYTERTLHKVSSVDQHFVQENCEIISNKVNIATSPILIGPSEETTLVEPSTNKISIATSPINEVSKKTLEVTTKMVQTETPSSDQSVVPSNNSRPEISTDDKPLLAPSFKLNPTPIENIVQVSLGQSSDTSLALQSSSTNQNIKLVVQLPNLARDTDENKKVAESDSLVVQEPNQSLIKPNQHLRSQGERNTQSFNNNNAQYAKFQHELPKSQEVGPNFQIPFYQNLNEKTIQDIIEPTVSEVLKKISTSQNNHSSALCGNIQGNEHTRNKILSTHSEPTKPNIVLQTKHGIWKTFDDSPVYGFIDLEHTKHVVDSSNQTEKERQNVCTQVANSFAGSLNDKAVSARKEEAASTTRRSYLEMLQPSPHSSFLNIAGSSGTHSSVFRSSSARSSSQTSNSSNRKDVYNNDGGYLSEGEIMPKLCNCLFGEICSVCIPKLDLSFGELKTKRRKEKRTNILESDSDSDCTRNISTKTDSLTQVPVSLELLPDPSKTTSKSDVMQLNPQISSIPQISSKTHCSETFKAFANTQSEARKLTSKPFSEIVDSVMCELNKENLKKKKHNVYGGQVCSGSVKNTDNSPSHKQDCSSSSNTQKSGKSKRTSSTFKEHKSVSRVPFVMKPPLESTKINVIVEDSDDVSISSYQTSVTSVSVDNLPAALSSYSSGEI